MSAIGSLATSVTAWRSQHVDAADWSGLQPVLRELRYPAECHDLDSSSANPAPGSPRPAGAHRLSPVPTLESVADEACPAASSFAHPELPAAHPEWSACSSSSDRHSGFQSCWFAASRWDVTSQNQRRHGLSRNMPVLRPAASIVLSVASPRIDQRFQSVPGRYRCGPRSTRQART